MRKIRTLLAATLTVVAISSCAPGLEVIDPLPYQSSGLPDLRATKVDDLGVHVYEREGTRYRHPVAQAQFALQLVDAWRQTGDDSYLEQAEVNASDLIEARNDRFVPYEFDFELHGDPANTIHAPWYSAMAQGQLLSLTVRLYEATGSTRWLDVATEVLETISAVRDDEPDPGPWVTFVDDDGYLWLEEYAGDVPPMRVLNGHIFAMFGLYDYWRVTRSEQAASLFQEAARTVKHYVPMLRVPGEPSWYGMRIQDNPVAQSEKYHRIHISQLRTLAGMTGDSDYSELADLLEDDFS